MEKEITINGLKLCYDESGPDGAPPVILMHGWGCEHSTVASIANAINSKLKVYSLDLPGHGKSQEPPQPWGIEKFADLIEDFITTLNLSNPILIGHSFGGRISIVLGSRIKTNKIVLVDSAGIKPHHSLKYYLKVYSFKTAKKVLPILFGKKKGHELIDAWRGKAGSADYRQSSPMMRSVMSICVNEDLKHLMPSIKAPTLLIWGENDTATPLSDAKTMERLIPDAGLVSFPEAGHYSFLDNPGQFRAVIQSFLLK
ncbi:MAG: alpha/beta hydrolase [Muribaculaceae bacterium]|nr:alpha/beta hydrolase [Muribaculaceae bacterium]